MSLPPLDPACLFRACELDALDFSSTAELPDVELALGQSRALEALHFGMTIPHSGYNLFVLGPSGAGRLTLVRQAVEQQAAQQPAASDWCYLNNFEQTNQPQALRLPGGSGKPFYRAVEKLIEDLSTAIPAAFEGEEYRARAEEIEESTKAREADALNELRREALRQHIMLVETPTGFAFAPVDQDDEVLSPDTFKHLPEATQDSIRERVENLQQTLQKLLRQFPGWRREAKEKIRELNRGRVRYAVTHLIEALRESYLHLPELADYLERMERDIVERGEEFLPRSDSAAALFSQPGLNNPFARYRINLLVDHDGATSAPVVHETLPTYANLIGRVEYQAHMGALFTDFSMIRAGALHRANGGYLILDALSLLSQPFAWDALKRALRTGELTIESLERRISLVHTSGLEPAAIPLSVKVILIGDRRVYYLLAHYDPEFADLFKVAADFEESIERDDRADRHYAQVIASLARRAGLRPLQRAAVARLIEHGARLAEDSAKLSTHLRSLADVLKEADHWAAQSGAELIDAAHIQRALDHQVHRADRIRRHLHDAIRRGTLLIDVDGAAVGQVNGLSVLSLGDFSFGQPVRITATTRLGNGKVLDIERETELGGALHSKGVLILSSFLAARYARFQPFSVAASVVFEQSYGMVEGDSASLAELCAILSSLAERPIRQAFAMTGSVNQHGQVQPIGGVNQKIEGFFDVCVTLGLTGQQGVIIPAANVQHLMLRHDVVAACRAGRFAVYAVRTVDEALELLMDGVAGERAADGVYPPDSLNGLVEAHLRRFSSVQKEWIATKSDAIPESR